MAYFHKYIWFPQLHPLIMQSESLARHLKIFLVLHLLILRAFLYMRYSSSSSTFFYFSQITPYLLSFLWDQIHFFLVSYLLFKKLFLIPKSMKCLCFFHFIICYHMLQSLAQLEFSLLCDCDCGGGCRGGFLPPPN